MAAKKAKRYCKFENCNLTDVDGIRMYRFPRDEKRSKLWLQICSNADLELHSTEKLYSSSYVCEDHFQDWCFLNVDSKHRLVFNAIPGLDKESAIEQLNKINDKLTDDNHEMTSGVSKSNITVVTHDMHTAGEPLRIVTSGFPTLSGSVLDKRKQMKETFDHYRKFLINEPRGHKDMYGAILLQKNSQDNSFEVIFFHNEGYSTMCGHAIIALGRYVVDAGLVKSISPETQVNFHCPCGLVETHVKYDDNKVTGVRFHSVPAFVFLLDTTIIVPDFGNISIDISFGGTYYAIVEDKQLGLSLEYSPLSDLVNAAALVTEAAKKQVKLHHPVSKDLAFLYGTIITDGKDQFTDGATKNLCVFADKEVDRSPTGSGVTARIALQVKKGLISLNQEKEFKSVIRTSFTGKAVKLTKMWKFEAVIVEVSGMAYHTGDHSFYLEDNDPLTEGFQLPINT